MAEMLPWVRPRFFDEDGKPLAGGKLYSYVAGTAKPIATYSDRSGVSANTNPIILDSNGECDVYIGPGSFKFILTDADDNLQWTRDNIQLVTNSNESMPSGGLEGSVLVKMSDADFITEWKQFAFEGFSARFGQFFSSTTLLDTLSKILNLQYTAPAISLSASGGSAIREKGEAVTSTILTAAITKRSDPIAAVRFYRNPSTLLDTQTSGGGIPNGGNSTYSWTGSFSDTTTFRAEVDDNGATGGPTTVSATTTFTFVYPYYDGAGSVGLTASAVAGLTKSKIVSTATVNRTFTATSGQVFYFAYPASYGALTSILDVNGFETLPDWTLRTENITGLDGNPVSYRIYEFKNPVVAGSYYYSFRR